MHARSHTSRFAHSRLAPGETRKRTTFENGTCIFSGSRVPIRKNSHTPPNARGIHENLVLPSHVPELLCSLCIGVAEDYSRVATKRRTFIFSWWHQLAFKGRAHTSPSVFEGGRLRFQVRLSFAFRSARVCSLLCCFHPLCMVQPPSVFGINVRNLPSVCVCVFASSGNRTHRRLMLNTHFDFNS